MVGDATPLLQFVDWGDRYEPYPISWGEQEVCELRRDWEVKVLELSALVFIIPRERVKNGVDRLVLLNTIARSVVEGERGRHPTHLFTYRGNPVTKMYNGLGSGRAEMSD